VDAVPTGAVEEGCGPADGPGDDPEQAVSRSVHTTAVATITDACDLSIPRPFDEADSR
jgi:hypothetical protein